MKKHLFFLNFLITFFLTIFLTSCVVLTPFDKNLDQKRLEESFGGINDVPYPAHFGLDKKNTQLYHLRGVLSGVIVAAGRMNIEEIAAYYDEHLTYHEWVPVAEAQTDKLVSTWKKDNRILTIIAQPTTLSIGSDTKLELWVGAPLKESDLGSRVMYKKPTATGEKFSTTPSFGSSASGNYSSSDDFSEEELY